MQNVIDFKPSVVEKINWNTLFFVAAFHIVAVAAFFTFSWANLAAGLVCWWVAASWGIGIGYHRLLTHRGFKVPKWLEYFFTTCGTLALQSGPLAWSQRTAFTMHLPRAKKIRTVRETAHTGRTSAGYSAARRRISQWR